MKILMAIYNYLFGFHKDIEANAQAIEELAKMIAEKEA